MAAETSKTKESALGLSQIPGEWEESLWDGNFCGEDVTLPYEAVEESVLLNEDSWESLVDACAHWPHAVTSEGAGFWTTLMEADVSYKCILAVLYCIMERTKLRAVDRICAAHAARLYVTLLQLPGSGGGFKLYHPMLFQKALNVVYLYPEAGGNKNSEGVGGGRGSKGRRGRGRKRKVVEEESVDMDDEDALLEAGGVVEAGREDTIIKLLKLFVLSVWDYLSVQALSDSLARYQLTQALLHLARKELDSASSLVLSGGPSPSADQDSSVAQGEARLACPVGQDAPMFVLVWACLDVLCRQLHGPIEKITSEVFRQLLPSLLMLTESGGVVTAATLPSDLVLGSKNALAFVMHVARSGGEPVWLPLMTLIQHICTKIPDKAEYRNKMAVVTCQLLCLLPVERYSSMLEWLYKFSRNTKVGFRVFALDLVACLLTLPLRQLSAADDLSRECAYRLTYKFLVRMILSRMILSRCSDKAPSVRSRALTCLAAAASGELSECAAATPTIKNLRAF